MFSPNLTHYICVLSWPIETCTLPRTVLWWHHCISVSSEIQNHFYLVLLQAVIANQRRKYLFVSAVIYFPRHLQKAPVQIAFLIRIKEEVSLLGWECEAFAASAAYAICAESSERLILATAVTQFTDLCGDSFLVNTGFSPRKQHAQLNSALSCWQRTTRLFPQTNCLKALSFWQTVLSESSPGQEVEKRAIIRSY